MNSPETTEALLACEVCMKEVPRSEDVSDEGRDYVLHFFGVDCYDQWKKVGPEPREE